MHKISVIVAVHNAHDTLRRCMDSLIHQTLQDIEIICVDDGSKDDSLSILQEYAAKDGRVKVIHQENAGAGAARNNGMQYADGEYLSILDCDDFFEPEMLEKSYACAKKKEADIVAFRCDFYYETRNEFSPCLYSVNNFLIPPKDPFSMKDVKKETFNLFIGWAWDKLFRTEFVRQHALRFQEIHSTNDLLFVYSALFCAERITVLQDVLAHYSRGAGSLSNTREKAWNCAYKALDAMRAFLQENGLYQRFEQDFKNYCLHFLLNYYWGLKEPARSQMIEAMSTQWFEEFDLLRHPQSYFHNQSQYELFRALANIPPEQFAAKPQVSVVIPVRDHAACIRTCMDQMIRQTLREMEIICVDAFSTDGTWEILQEYAAKDARVKLIRTTCRNQGHQVNWGYYASIGRYFAIVRPEDCVEPNLYAELVSAADQAHADIVKTDFWRYASKDARKLIKIGKNGLYNRPLEAKNVYQDMLVPENMCTGNGIYRFEFLTQNNLLHDEITGTERPDKNFQLKTTFSAGTVYFCDKPMYGQYRNEKRSFAGEKHIGKIDAEYELVLAYLRDDPGKFSSAMPYYWAVRLKEYFFLSGKFSRWKKDELLMRIWKPVRANREEIKQELFSDKEWAWLMNIAEKPEAYYAKICKRLSMRKKVGKINVFKRIGDCICDHGLKYTLKYLLKRIRGRQ